MRLGQCPSIWSFFFLEGIPKFFMLTKETDVIYDYIRNNPNKGKLIEEFVTEPPCSNNEIVMKFKIRSICEFNKVIATNRESFLKLMMYTKQSPVFLDTEKEYLSLFQQANNTLNANGYFYRQQEVIEHTHS